MSIFNLPDLGEGLPDGEIVRWYVKLGDKLQVDDPLVAIETAKAIVDVPSPVAGEIVKLYGQPGDIIATGSPLVEFKDNIDSGTVVGKLEENGEFLEAPTLIEVNNHAHKKHSAVRASFAVRQLAKRLNVDLDSITPSGPDNTVTSADVEAMVVHQDDKYKLVKGAKRGMAQAMTLAANEVVPVSIYDDAQLIGWEPEKNDISVRVIKAIVGAVAVEPILNSWFNGKQISSRVHETINLGVAVDTEDGLFVPVINDVASLSAEQLRAAMNNLKNKVASRDLSPEELQGATFTLSNFGKFAGRYATPMISPPQVGILGVGKLRLEPIVTTDGQLTSCWVLPLSLTFDHRACTGGEGARFLAALINELTK